MPELLASVIIPTRDRRELLVELLDALGKQTVPRDRFEVIIADDGSAEPAYDLATDDGWVRISPGPPLSEYAARNRAAGEARAQLFCFVDSDCVPEPQWLEAAIAALANAELVAGRVRFILPERRTIWALLDMDATKDQERLVRANYAETANLSVRRELFERIGGFEPDVVGAGGDFDFVRRALAADARLVYAHDACAWHPTRNSARQYLWMIWNFHRQWAVRETRRGRRPLGTKLRWWVPLALHVRWRLQEGRSLGLDRRWLGANGVRLRARDNLLGVPILYVLVPYLGGIAQLVGSHEGRKRRSELAEQGRGRPGEPAAAVSS
jgi:GT2 family glycosyltransferase